jgi:hypothetical protein
MQCDKFNIEGLLQQFLSEFASCVGEKHGLIKASTRAKQRSWMSVEPRAKPMASTKEAERVVQGEA